MERSKKEKRKITTIKLGLAELENLDKIMKKYNLENRSMSIRWVINQFAQVYLEQNALLNKVAHLQSVEEAGDLPLAIELWLNKVPHMQSVEEAGELPLAIESWEL